MALSQRLAYISDLDRSFLGRFSDLSANFDQPLSRSWTYDNDAKERQIFIEEEVAVVRREVADLERFLEGKWREWDDCKSAEAEAFAQIIQGLEETRRDEELGQDMAALRKEIKKAEKEAIEEMRDYNKVRACTTTRFWGNGPTDRGCRNSNARRPKWTLLRTVTFGIELRRMRSLDGVIFLFFFLAACMSASQWQTWA